MSSSPTKLSISAVERETGISKEVLRKWESRYGFPCPARDAQGERLYPPEQVTRLRLIKRLLDAGVRPSKVVPESVGDLSELAGQRHMSLAGPAAPALDVALLSHLRAHDLTGLRQLLQRLLLDQGMRRFVLDTVAPLTYLVGEAWARGELEIFEEHLYTEVIQGLLRNAVDRLADPQTRPRVLLTTPPEEAHALGILMVGALLALDGAYCVPLGPQTPLEDIANAALAHEVDVVVLSFSIAYPARQVLPVLAELRSRLAPEVEIWAGGAGTARTRRVLEGVRITPSLEDAIATLAAWQAAHRV